MFTQFLTHFQDYAWRTLWVGLLLLLIELAFPASKYSLLSRARGLWFWIVYILITSAALALFAAAWQKLGVSPALMFRPAELLRTGFAPLRLAELTLALILAGYVGDFFYYWFHRLQHSNPLLWEFHKVHHSIREMSALNSNHHFTEEIFRIPFVTLPMSLVLGVDAGPTPLIVAIIFSMQGLYEHSCTRLNWGPLRYVLADNRFHRIHHSVEEGHWNKNFGSFSTIWDLVFGTAHMPRKDEWPETGIPGVSEPKTLHQFLFAPFSNLLGSKKQ